MAGIYGQDWSGYTSARPSTSGLSFVFTKITEGTGYVNPEWVPQRADALAGGCVFGGYHYPHLANPVTAELDFFLSHYAPAPGELVVLDWEGYDSANQGVPHSRQVAYKDAWIRAAKAALPYNPVGMYCNLDYWRHVDTTGYYGDFLWIATAGLPAGQPGIAAPWLFHQYGASGVDRDYCHLDKAALVTWATSFAKPVTPPAPPVPAPAVLEDDSMLPPIPPKSAWPFDFTVSIPKGTKHTVGFNCDNTRVGEPPATLRVAILGDGGNFAEVVTVDSSKQTVITFGNPAQTTGVSVLREDAGTFTVGMEVS